MTSHKIEDLHTAMLDKLLSESGLECHRSPDESEVSEALPEEPEEQSTDQKVEEPTEAVQEEEQSTVVEEIEEEKPEIFPSPSLRRVVPDRIRQIEETNRIHVLPKTLNTDIDPQAIPKIAYTAPQKCIDILAEIVGCKKYKSSLAEFWFLDTMANLLRRAQDDELDRPTQAVLILWFCEWMKEMQHFDAADRLRMLKRFKDNMLAAARFIADEDHLPTPTEAGVFYMSEEERVKGAAISKVISEAKHLVTFENAAYECSLRDLTKIIHYIFDLFSTDYQYDLVRSVFTMTPQYYYIDSPYQIQNPKRIYVPLKTKPKKDKPKKEPKDKKGKKKEVDTVEYLALMELKARDEREQEEQEEKDREEYNLRSHILPLGFAATDELFDKYWPPPPPEPEPEPVVVVKGKKGKK